MEKNKNEHVFEFELGSKTPKLRAYIKEGNSRITIAIDSDFEKFVKKVEKYLKKNPTGYDEIVTEIAFKKNKIKPTKANIEKFYQHCRGLREQSV